MTQDLDIQHATDPGNLDALGGALVALEARLAGVSDPSRPTAQRCGASRSWALGTARARAERYDVGSLFVLVASVDDLLRMKRAAGGPKDLAELEVIRERRSASRAAGTATLPSIAPPTQDSCPD